jgi:hypothetical protein
VTGIDDGLIVDAVFPHRISWGVFHGFAPKIRRTEVCPICRCRAISDLLMPARCKFRILASCRAAVFGRPRRLPFCRAGEVHRPECPPVGRLVYTVAVPIVFDQEIYVSYGQFYVESRTDDYFEGLTESQGG